jgi:hypothetical protein
VTAVTLEPWRPSPPGRFHLLAGGETVPRSVIWPCSRPIFAYIGTEARFIGRDARFPRNRCTLHLQPIALHPEPIHGSSATDHASPGTDTPFLCNRCTVHLQPITLHSEPMHGSPASDHASPGTDSRFLCKRLRKRRVAVQIAGPAPDVWSAATAGGCLKLSLRFSRRKRAVRQPMGSGAPLLHRRHRSRGYTAHVPSPPASTAPGSDRPRQTGRGPRCHSPDLSPAIGRIISHPQCMAPASSVSSS